MRNSPKLVLLHAKWSVNFKVPTFITFISSSLHMYYILSRSVYVCMRESTHIHIQLKQFVKKFNKTKFVMIPATRTEFNFWVSRNKTRKLQEFGKIRKNWYSERLESFFKPLPLKKLGGGMQKTRQVKILS